ncbi:MAG: coenzyme A pyrophosphatase [Rhodobacteraceae bacterium]|nr:coenzyme A pyrophosphatase [Paracoccaceae bacterium]
MLITSSSLETIKSRFTLPTSKEIKIGSLSEPSSDFDLSTADKKKLKGHYKKVAAVFILLRKKDLNISVVFTKRSNNLSVHPGQISFPGGAIEPYDKSILHAGLREVEEEIGLVASKIETVGLLRPHETVSKFLIHPFIGIVRTNVKFKINPCEVAEIFEVPLAFLLNRENMKEHQIVTEKEYRGYYAIPYGPYYIWGATASIIKNFIDRYHK